MEEKKSVSFAALLISAAVAVVLIFGVKFVGGNSKAAAAKNNKENVAEGEGSSSAYTAGIYEASAQGAMGQVSVTVTVDENGAVTGLEIDSSVETDSIGQAAAAKLQGQILEAGSIEGIDAVSGATLTSNAIFNGITDCLNQASEAGGADGAEVGGAYTAGTYEASAQGAMGQVGVIVTLDGNGVVTGLEIDSSVETDSIGQAAAAKLQGQILEAGGIEGIDAISGATLTSEAIFNGITDCLSQAAN